MNLSNDLPPLSTRTTRAVVNKRNYVTPNYRRPTDHSNLGESTHRVFRHHNYTEEWDPGGEVGTSDRSPDGPTVEEPLS